MKNECINCDNTGVVFSEMGEQEFCTCNKGQNVEMRYNITMLSKKMKYT